MMSEATRTVGPLNRRASSTQSERRDLWDAMGEMHALQTKASGKIDALVAAVGAPGAPDAGVPATGLFAHLEAHNRRITKFERLWERGVGFCFAAIPLITALWWLAGDKIAHLLHG